jgi:photosystem II stability/assembly factor-like uncharacterized protein
VFYCSGSSRSALPGPHLRPQADSSSTMRRLSLLALLLALVLLVFLAAAGTALALPGWSVMAAPLGKSVRPSAAGAFGDAGVVVAGQGGTVAVSRDGGRTWTDISAAALTSSALRGVAFSDAKHGVVVGDKTTILIGAPDDRGVFGWTAPALRDEVTADLRDVAMQGTVGYAVGTGGLVLQTVDGGKTWRRERVASRANLNAVAMSADGQIVAVVGDQGTVLTKKEGSWKAAETSTSADLLDVGLPADSALNVVYCCSSKRVFSLRGAGLLKLLAVQPSLPAGGAIHALALVESPRKTRLVVGGTGGWLAGLVTGGSAWAKQTGGAASTVTSLAAAGNGVGYATTAGGRVERTLSGGARFTLALKTMPSVKNPDYKAIITTGASVALSGSTTILASGVLLLQALPARETAWQTLAHGDPGATRLSDRATPGRNTSYRLRFIFAGATAATGTKVAVGVRHKVSVSTTSRRLPLHEVFRVRGSVAPTAPAGRYVEVWTDRVGDHRLGAWHRIHVGSRVLLTNGRTFVTRTFGTPVREMYHLKIRMAGDGRHLAGWSPRITVTVR